MVLSHDCSILQGPAAVENTLDQQASLSQDRPMVISDPPCGTCILSALNLEDWSSDDLARSAASVPRTSNKSPSFMTLEQKKAALDATDPQLPPGLHISLGSTCITAEAAGASGLLVSSSSKTRPAKAKDADHDESVFSTDPLLSSDPLTVLGLPQGATVAEIEKAFKTMILKYHPDKNRGNEEWAADASRHIIDAIAKLRQMRQVDLRAKLKEFMAAEGMPDSYQAYAEARWSADGKTWRASNGTGGHSGQAKNDAKGDAAEADGDMESEVDTEVEATGLELSEKHAHADGEAMDPKLVAMLAKRRADANAQPPIQSPGSSSSSHANDHGSGCVCGGQFTASVCKSKRGVADAPHWPPSSALDAEHAATVAAAAAAAASSHVADAPHWPPNSALDSDHAANVAAAEEGQFKTPEQQVRMAPIFSRSNSVGSDESSSSKRRRLGLPTNLAAELELERQSPLSLDLQGPKLPTCSCKVHHKKMAQCPEIDVLLYFNITGTMQEQVTARLFKPMTFRGANASSWTECVRLISDKHPAYKFRVDQAHPQGVTHVCMFRKADGTVCYHPFRLLIKNGKSTAQSHEASFINTPVTNHYREAHNIATERFASNSKIRFQTAAAATGTTLDEHKTQPR